MLKNLSRNLAFDVRTLVDGREADSVVGVPLLVVVVVGGDDDDVDTIDFRAHDEDEEEGGDCVLARGIGIRRSSYTASRLLTYRYTLAITY